MAAAHAVTRDPLQCEFEPHALERRVRTTQEALPYARRQTMAERLRGLFCAAPPPSLPRYGWTRLAESKPQSKITTTATSVERAVLENRTEQNMPKLAANTS